MMVSKVSDPRAGTGSVEAGMYLRKEECRWLDLKSG